MQQTQKKLGDLDCVIVRDENCETPSAVVILSHGFGAPGGDLVSLANEFAQLGSPFNSIVYVFPAAPIEMDPLFDSRAWWPIDMEKLQLMMMQGETRQMRVESPEKLPACRVSLTKVIDHCRVDYSMPASKIVIGGFSQGSMLSTDVAIHYPEQLGGLIVWSGALINEKVWSPKANEIPADQKLTVVQSHGRVDPVVPFAAGEDLRDMLTETGHEVRFVEFNGQHSIPMQAISQAAQLIKEVTSETSV
ncbi:MAG: alpha/beta hydrolase [Mariniblastus sp.]